MIINEHGLQAFVTLARTQNFSRAAVEVGITQPALSIRVRQLERELGTTLVRRMRSGITLTDAGQQLLQYCKLKSELERELLSKISSEDSSFGGAVRIAGSSSVMRPAVFRALAKLIRKNPLTEVEFYVRELVDLEPMLHRGETDFIVLNTETGNRKLESIRLGHEQIVVIESSKYRERDAVFLDADPKDQFTEKYLQIQHYTEPYRRAFVQDEFCIHEGVALGFGRAVVHAHMIRKGLPVRIAKGFKPYREPVVLHYLKQPFYSPLHKAIVRELKTKISIYLSPN